MRIALIAGLVVLAGSCATGNSSSSDSASSGGGSRSGPRLAGTDLIVAGAPVGAGLYAVTAYRTPVSNYTTVDGRNLRIDKEVIATREIAAGGRKLHVEPEPMANVASGGRIALTEQAAGTNGCVVLVDAKDRAVPVWSSGGDRYGFSLRPAQRVFEARAKTAQAEADVDRAYLSEMAARRAVSDAQARLDRSPAYANRACSPVRPVPMEAPRDLKTPSQAARVAEGVVQEAMVARYGCNRASAALTQMGKRPEWEGFAAGFVCSAALTPKEYPSDSLTIVADLFEDQMLSCMLDSGRSLGAQLTCGAAFMATATTRYNDDVGRLTQRYNQSWFAWQDRVRAEEQRVDRINQSCASDLSIVRSGPSGIASEERNVAGRKADLATAQKRLEELLKSPVAASEMRCG